MSSALRRLLSVLQDLGLHSWNIEIAQSREARRDPACEQRDVRRCCGEEAQARDAWYGIERSWTCQGSVDVFAKDSVRDISSAGRDATALRVRSTVGMSDALWLGGVGGKVIERCVTLGSAWRMDGMYAAGAVTAVILPAMCTGRSPTEPGERERGSKMRAVSWGCLRTQLITSAKLWFAPSGISKVDLYKAFQFLGDGFLLQGDEVTAHSLFEIALEAFTEMDIHQSRADCMLHLGDIAKQSGDLIKAVELWKHARPLFEQSLQTKEVAKIDTRLAAVDVDLLWQHEKSLQYLRTLNAPTTLLQTGIDQLNIEVDGNGRVPNVRLHWAEEQDGLKMGPKKMAARKFFREVVYKEAIPKFLEIMKEIGQGQGWGLAEVKQRFSNELWDEFLFGDSLK
ncbi:hypothetical protein FB451DRAFT_1523903 [Mycena latifolia]|nr:hypothetical protein FB451DRAFT_1523903 [Mycena latifolia]